jgi:DNA mismatch repair protein MutS2
MHPGTFRALEFDRIVEVVRGLAITPLGRARLAGLVPDTDPARVESALALTTEAVHFLAESSGFPLQAPRDLEAALDTLAIEGRALEPLALVGLAGFLESVQQAAAAIRRAAPGRFPLLGAIAARAAAFDAEIADIRHAIDPTGEVGDQASAQLRGIRERLRKQRARLRNTLESYIRGKDTQKYLQDQIVTDRNGRYVLLVRAEHRSAIPGIVHGGSASGASVFLEPLSTVEINNEIVSLQEQEAAEVRRILLALTDALRRRALDLRATLDAAADLDAAQARARLSRLVDGVAPRLSDDGGVELRAARHPLLVPAVDARLREAAGDAGAPARPARSAGPVPVDLVVTPPATVLVITGPNTGGKTVALKTVGLLALMAQAGLHVPAAEGSRLPVFRTIFADIGDEQSIAADLSTFSWHVTNLASMDAAMALPSLVLLDEVGAGTDPVEGGALGMAVIDHFRTRGAIVVATTHSDTLKTYASTTPGVACAAFGFDPETFAPTYRLHYGTPGRSLALEMAARLGLRASIIEAARQYRSAREAQLAEHLARVDEELRRLEHERRLVAREREQIAEQEARFRSREEALRHREEQFRQRLDAELDERLRTARREIDAVVDDLKRRAAALVSQAARRSAAADAPLSTGETGVVRAEARAALERVADRARAGVAEAAPAAGHAGGASPGSRPSPGDRVAVGPLGFEGIVQAVHGREVEVNVRGKRMRATVDELRVLGAAPASAAGRVSVEVHARESAASDLNLIGCTVDEALSRTDKFLDEAIISELRTVRVIHGHGTGQLRRALAEFLQHHPLVARFALAPADQGGGGVTVVELKD